MFVCLCMFVYGNVSKTIINCANHLKLPKRDVKVLNDIHTPNQVNRLNKSMIFRLLKNYIDLKGGGGVQIARSFQEQIESSLIAFVYPSVIASVYVCVCLCESMCAYL